MSKDIASVLAGWDHDPDDVQVRIVAGDDGRDKLQMRVELGLLQMELSGRPDGSRPEGFESLLDAHEAEAREAEGRGDDYQLGPEACRDLMREGYQYYQRYLAAFHLQRYDLVVRDTERNLRLFAFAVRHARRQRDRLQFDYRPYVLMMRARARAHMALTTRRYDTALGAIDEGVAAIRGFLHEYQQEDQEAECAELVSLQRFRTEVERERPVGPAERLERQLAQAVAQEEYEEAARLRDQIQRLRGLALRPEPRAS